MILPASELVARYGTHVLNGIVLGAKLDIFYKTETIKSNRNQAGTIGLNFNLSNAFNINSGISYTASENSGNFNQTIVYRSFGGDNNLKVEGSIYLEKGTDIPATVNFSAWENSCSDENMTLIDFAPNGLSPLSEFIEDPTKKAEVESYINQYLAQNQINVNYQKVAIHRYYHPSATDHYYTQSYSPNGIGSWYYEGVEFKALKNRAPGSFPVHRYWTSKYGNHYYELAEYPRYISSDYVYEGVEFYAFDRQVAGTIPVYRHYHARNVDHFYTTYSGSIGGYIAEGVKFYAYPR